mgnify:CR=1 FL=1
METKTTLLDSRVPSGPLEDKWENHKFDLKLVNPANKRKHKVCLLYTSDAADE